MVYLYRYTTSYDPMYRFIVWKPENGEITQASIIEFPGRTHQYIVNTAEEFIAHFEMPAKPVSEIVTVGDYNAVVYKDYAQIGCQTISRETVEGVLEIMKKLS